MLGDPQREDCDLDGEVVEVDTVEVFDADFRLREQHLMLGVELGEAFQDCVLNTMSLSVAQHGGPF